MLSVPFSVSPILLPGGVSHVGGVSNRDGSVSPTPCLSLGAGLSPPIFDSGGNGEMAVVNVFRLMLEISRFKQEGHC